MNFSSKFRNQLTFLFSLIIVLVVAGCGATEPTQTSSDVDASNVSEGFGVSTQRTSKQILVASELVACGEDGLEKCMQVQEKGQERWLAFEGEIEGFSYEVGTSYTLRIIETTDRDVTTWTLRRIIDQQNIVQETENEPTTLEDVSRWQIVHSGFDPLPENPVMVSMTDSMMTVDTACYMYSGRYTTDPIFDLSPLSEVDSQCDTISEEAQFLVLILSYAHSYRFNSDTSLDFVFRDGVTITLEPVE